MLPCSFQGLCNCERWQMVHKYFRKALLLIGADFMSYIITLFYMITASYGEWLNQDHFIYCIYGFWNVENNTWVSARQLNCQILCKVFGRFIHLCILLPSVFYCYRMQMLYHPCSTKESHHWYFSLYSPSQHFTAVSFSWLCSQCHFKPCIKSSIHQLLQTDILVKLWL